MEPQTVIAVVDDDPSVRKALKRMVCAAGYEVNAFESAEDFLDSLPTTGQSSCLILDVHLPGMSGLELQASLQKSGNTTPILFISAFSDSSARERAIQDGAVGFLPKPLDSDRLLEAIEQALAI